MNFPSLSNNAVEETTDSWHPVLVMVCIYLFMFIERPWESFGFLKGIPIERSYAILLIVVATIAGRFKLVSSPTNKWVYGLLILHFILAPFAFNSEYAIDQGIEYAKMVVLYIMMLAVTEDERSLKILVRAFIFSMMFYMLHSLFEYHNGRHVWRMGISRMTGVDATYSDPNAFGASVVLSIPFVYALLHCEAKALYRKVYYSYFALALVCIVLTGSRSAFVALIFLLTLWGLVQKGKRKILILLAVFISVSAIWLGMPDEKKNRIRTLWDKDAGPINAHQSAEGRLDGLKVSWEMFKREPLTGIGAGGKNFIEYRMSNNVDKEGHESPTQAHILYGEVIAELGLFGAVLLCGLIFSISICARKTIYHYRHLTKSFKYLLSWGILASLFMLLLLGLGGHNFYRPLWLWLAAWSGSLWMLWNKDIQENQIET